MNENKIPGMPEIKFNKNGYEIRSDILGLANKLVLEEYKMKFAGWEMTQYRDPETKQVVAKVDMPEFPGLEKVLETAQKMYDFVNQNPKK
jgi:hypothetical protein